MSYRACGKLILFGEHFVVYGAPALAVPARSVHTRVVVTARPPGGELGISLEDRPDDASRYVPTIKRLLGAALGSLGVETGARVSVASTVPVGAGLGSSASLAVALVGALARARGTDLGPGELRRHAHVLERMIHGRPSGVDDTVVAHRAPLWFRRGAEPRWLDRPAALGDDWSLLAASDGSRRDTGPAVAAVGELRARAPGRFETLCGRAAEVARAGRAAFEAGDGAALGRQLDRNQTLLEQIGVSTEGLERLIAAARRGGALGAKLTGAGGGGFVVVAVGRAAEPAVTSALREAGAETILRERVVRGTGDAQEQDGEDVEEQEAGR